MSIIQSIIQIKKYLFDTIQVNIVTFDSILYRYRYSDLSTLMSTGIDTSLASN